VRRESRVGGVVGEHDVGSGLADDAVIEEGERAVLAHPSADPVSGLRALLRRDELVAAAHGDPDGPAGAL